MKVLYEQDTEGCIQETVIVEEKVLAEGLLAAELPAQLSIMPEAMRDMYYPYDNRPLMLLADADGSFHMTLQIIEQKLAPDETGSAAEAVRNCVERMYPHSGLSPVYLFRKGEIPVGWFAMSLDEAGEPFVHVKAVFPVHNLLCLTTITYPEPDRLKWMAIFNHFFATLQERGSRVAGSK